jgi:hypothetical protein
MRGEAERPAGVIGAGSILRTLHFTRSQSPSLGSRATGHPSLSHSLSHTQPTIRQMKAVLTCLLCALALVLTRASWYQPPVSLFWQWQLSIPFNFPTDMLAPSESFVNVALYDIDINATAAVIASIKSQGVKVLCYFEAGTYVSTRSYVSRYDTGNCTAAQLGKQRCGDVGLPYEAPYTNELWVNPASPTLRAVMSSILDEAAAKGCDGVEPDNVNGEEWDSGYITGWETCPAGTHWCDPDRSGMCNNPTVENCTLDYDLWHDFNSFLATQAHERNLTIVLKNNLYLARVLVDSHDLVLSEQCIQYNECDYYKPFIARGKPVLLTEYQTSLPVTCSVAATYNYSAITKTTSLTKLPYGACWNGLPASATNMPPPTPSQPPTSVSLPPPALPPAAAQPTSLPLPPAPPTPTPLATSPAPMPAQVPPASIEAPMTDPFAWSAGTVRDVWWM